jgi:hypothetical protein
MNHTIISSTSSYQPHHKSNIIVALNGRISSSPPPQTLLKGLQEKPLLRHHDRQRFWSNLPRNLLLMGRNPASLRWLSSQIGSLSPPKSIFNDTRVSISYTATYIHTASQSRWQHLPSLFLPPAGLAYIKLPEAALDSNSPHCSADTKFLLFDQSLLAATSLRTAEIRAKTKSHIRRIYFFLEQERSWSIRTLASHI